MLAYLNVFCFYKPLGITFVLRMLCLKVRFKVHFCSAFSCFIWSFGVVRYIDYNRKKLGIALLIGCWSNPSNSQWLRSSMQDRLRVMGQILLKVRSNTPSRTSILRKIWQHLPPIGFNELNNFPKTSL